MGRLTKYTKNFPEKAFKFASKGLTERQLSKKLGISQETLIQYKKKYPEFSEAIKRGQEESIDKVENALFKRAIGFDYKEIKVERKNDGGYVEEKTTTTSKKVLPDQVAMIFFLKNRRPDKWKDKPENVEDVNDKLERVIEAIENNVNSDL